MYVLIILFGLILGSFDGVVIDRTLRHQSFVKGRSTCQMCGHVLAWYDVIPIVSYIWLKGQCRYCHRRIPKYVLWYELCGLLLSVLAYTHAHALHAYIYLMAVMHLFLIISVIDSYTLMIPNEATLCLTCFSVMRFEWTSAFFLERVQALVLMGMMFLLVFLINRDGIGGGDLKLLLALTLHTGLKTLQGLLVACVLAGFYVLILRMCKRVSMKDKIPFGPFICLGYLLIIIGM